MLIMLCYVVELLIGRTDYMESKRQAEEEIKEVSSKKQKVDEVAAKQKNPATKVVPSKNGSAPVKKADPYYSSSEESFDEDEKPAAEVVPSKIGSAPAKKADSSDLESDESSDEDEPNTPATKKFNSRVKTLYVGNLSFSVQKSDIENFFRVCGEVVDVRLASCEDGKLKGFGHVEFATAEAAQYIRS
ncbi:putative nucleotide-binding alpha-beta plait domain-containing protein [Medicago truncatula]|uniref:Putative nucleotide-binding alpha-beta plait domain-containing protein n=1 Tax=Medicago truncatula TaxID=3880 RepID=A0A396INA4_MEDTR|nr:putative nucleotide-binding alpha-beta plait domain-containing protein [Medicago truncatula]